MWLKKNICYCISWLIKIPFVTFVSAFIFEVDVTKCFKKSDYMFHFTSGPKNLSSLFVAKDPEDKILWSKVKSDIDIDKIKNS